MIDREGQPASPFRGRDELYEQALEKRAVELAVNAVSEVVCRREDMGYDHFVELSTAIRDAFPASPPEQPADPLSDLVSGFAKALLAKLRLASANGRSGWERDDWEKQCQQGLLRHLEKGDPRDVAAYCAFMWHHGWITSPPEQPAAATTNGDRT